MKKVYSLLIICALAFGVCTPSAEAIVLCAKNKQKYSVKNRKVEVKASRLLVSQTSTCPSGYTAVMTTESAGGTLSSGVTLTGFWNISGLESATVSYEAGTISFPKPLATAPAVEIIRLATYGGAPTANCAGSASNPTAAPGYLCIYEGYSGNIAAGSTGYHVFDANGGAGTLASPQGVALYAYRSGLLPIYAWGTWAVTAP